MASGGRSCDPDQSESDFSDSDTDSGSWSSHAERPVCEFYNRGHCRYGERCRDQHVCRFFLSGSCKYGDRCRLQHSARLGPRDAHGHEVAESEGEEDEEEDGPYRWQLDLGRGWQNICNQHILEAQFSMPHNKGIRIYNTPVGAVSIDFTKMRVLEKSNLRVRRLGWRRGEWLWYYRGDHGWCPYAAKSSELENTFRNNARDSLQLCVNSTQYEINFKGMFQKNLSTGTKRSIRRRPKYKPTGSESGSSGRSVTWQFKGARHWHNFRGTDGCSISSSDIESCYQQKHQTLNFTLNGDTYTLDFTKMVQINRRTMTERKIRRQ